MNKFSFTLLLFMTGCLFGMNPIQQLRPAGLNSNVGKGGLSWLLKQAQSKQIMVPVLLGAGAGTFLYVYKQYMAGAMLSDNKKKLWQEILKLNNEISKEYERLSVSGISLFKLRRKISRYDDSMISKSLNIIRRASVINSLDDYEVISHWDETLDYKLEKGGERVTSELENDKSSYFILKEEGMDGSLFAGLKQIALVFEEIPYSVRSRMTNEKSLKLTASKLAFFFIENPELIIEAQEKSPFVLFLQDLKANEWWGVKHGSWFPIVISGRNILGKLVFYLVNKL